MFNVGRYDPSKQDKDGGRNHKKRKISPDKKQQSGPTASATGKSKKAEQDKIQIQDEKKKKSSDKNDGAGRQSTTNNQQDDRMNHQKKKRNGANATDKAAPVKSKKFQVIAKEQKEENQILDSLDGRFDRLIEIEFEPDETDHPKPGDGVDDGKQVELPELVAVVSDDVAIALELSKRPIRELAIAWQLRPFLVENLVERHKLEYFFPIQNLVIPHIIATSPYIQAPDLMITAPTGSGKTLSYVVPMLQAIPTHGPRLLRTIIILPGRELAMQVESVLRSYCRGSNIRTGLAVAAASDDNRNTDFATEHAALTDDPESLHPSQLRRRLIRDPSNVQLAMDLLDDLVPYPSPLIESSPIDILVCTPGRLVDHLETDRESGASGLSLQHLRYLVVDEADRLLAMGSYQNWLDRVLQLAPTCVRTLLVSATATTDPRRIARFHNLQHLSIASNQRYANVLTLPSTLQEYTVECAAAQKPLVLVSILMEQQQQQQRQSAEPTSVSPPSSTISMVFCASLEATHRLARLLQLLWIALGYDARQIGEMSSSVRGQDRRLLIDRCRNPNDLLSVLICSDGMARGMDLEQINTIVHYDIPITAPKTYVHRCGRTARAGRPGRAISLIKTGQMESFRKMRSLIRIQPSSSPSVAPSSQQQSSMIDDNHHRVVSIWPIQKNLVNDAIKVYPQCMDGLQKVLEAEENGTLLRQRDDTAVLGTYLNKQ